MEPTINSFSGRIVGSNNAQVVEQFNVMLRTSSEGLVLNHPPLVIAVVGDYIPIPEERNGISTIRECDARFLHQGKDASPDILCLLREDITKHIPQCLPLKGGRPIRAEPVVNLHEGLREGVGAEAVAQGEQHGGVGGDGEGVVVDDGHDKPLSAPFSRETLLYLLPRLVE